MRHVDHVFDGGFERGFPYALRFLEFEDGTTGLFKGGSWKTNREIDHWAERKGQVAYIRSFLFIETVRRVVNNEKDTVPTFRAEVRNLINPETKRELALVYLTPGEIKSRTSTRRTPPRDRFRINKTFYSKLMKRGMWCLVEREMERKQHGIDSRMQTTITVHHCWRTLPEQMPTKIRELASQIDYQHIGS